MARFSGRNLLKVTLVFFLFPFLAFLLLLIGLTAKNKKVILEGAIYAILFCVALTVPENNSLYGLASVVGVGSLGTSIVRSWMLRDMWLPHRRRAMGLTAPGTNPGWEHLPPPPPPSTHPAPAPAVAVDDLGAALVWVINQAKQNKYRLPSEAYVSILETCHTLDAILDSQRVQQLGDARFEYELDAIVREYLPTVVNSYLAVPPAMVDDRQPNGRTPNQELSEQLSLLSGQAEALHNSRHRQTSADLTTNGNFLRERFGHHQQGGFDFGIE